MFEMDKPEGDKAEIYATLQAQARALVEGEADPIANAANLAALIYHALEQVNWAGFYLLRDGELVVGPFQGKPACVRIPLGRGVCGTAAARRETLRVADVDEFAGHIPCDSASRSEIVVPLVKDGNLIGVLDIDSPIADRFDTADQAGIEALAQIYVAALG
jgi:GAF domain-containing protein